MTALGPSGALTVGNHAFVACDGTDVLLSVNGVNWRTIAVLPTSVGSLAAGNNVVVAVGDGVIYYSPFDVRVDLPQLFPGDSWRVAVSGPAGPTLRLEGSVNLTQWQPLGTTTTGRVELTDSATNQLARFYRAVKE